MSIGPIVASGALDVRWNTIVEVLRGLGGLQGVNVFTDDLRRQYDDARGGQPLGKNPEIVEELPPRRWHVSAMSPVDVFVQGYVDVFAGTGFLGFMTVDEKPNPDAPYLYLLAVSLTARGIGHPFKSFVLAKAVIFEFRFLPRPEMHRPRFTSDGRRMRMSSRAHDI